MEGLKLKNDKKIRNSTAEFLMFTSDTGTESIEVRVENEDIWLTQKMISILFDVQRPAITKHLKNIFESGELNEESVCSKMEHTAADGKKYTTNYYNLDAVISIGYRVNSKKATEFRKWATKVIKEFSIKGYVLDKERLKNGTYLNEDFFNQLIEDIREIRASERKFYQKITDIYATALDYNASSVTTKDFFAHVQNKLHFAIHGNTAAELIMQRADANKKNMGLSSWKNAPSGKIIKTDVSIAKNYLRQSEIEQLNLFVSMYLDYAELQAKKHIPMMMEDWIKKLDAFLQFNEYEILNDKGKVTAAISKAFAEKEFEKFRIIQDLEFKSDFDKLIDNIGD